MLLYWVLVRVIVYSKQHRAKTQHGDTRALREGALEKHCKRKHRDTGRRNREGMDKEKGAAREREGGETGDGEK